MCRLRDAWNALGAALLVVLTLAACGPEARREAPRVVDGVLDARGWDLDRDGPLRLAGEWRVAWNVAAEEVVGMPPDRREVPGAITAGPHPREWDRGTGAATFVVRIVGLAAGAGAHVYVPPNYATRLRCSSATETLEGGRNTRATPDDRLSMAAYVAPCPHGDVTIAITARTPSYLEGASGSGLTSAPLLMTPMDALATSERRVASDAVLVALMAAFALVLGIEAVSGRAELAPWFFAGSAVGTTYWFASASELLERLGFSHTPLRLRVEYASVPFISALLLSAVSRFAAFRMPRAFRLLEWGGAFVALVTLVGVGVPLRALLSLGQVASVAAGLTVTVAAALALARPRTDVDARLIGLGVMTTTSVGVLDVIVSQRGLEPLHLVSRSIVGLFLVVVFVTLRRSARARTAAERFAGSTKRFVPEEFLHALGHDDITTVRLGEAATRDVSILFADIREFTTLSEHMTPEETFGFLNACLSRMGPHVRHHGGFVDKYIGDAIMALLPDSANDAIRAAIAMQRETRGTGEERRGLEIGVGIHRGRVMMGTIGEASRFEATVIADAVNLTARLESLTKQFGCGILISGEVASCLDDDLLHTSRRLGTFAVKGRSVPVDVFEVFASDLDAIRAAKLASRERLRRMLSHHAAGELDEAISIAGELRDAHPEDGPIAWWFVRLQHELVEGEPAPGGVVRLLEK
jgi:class 3 adenylate cyclase